MIMTLRAADRVSAILIHPFLCFRDAITCTRVLTLDRSNVFTYTY